MIRLEPICFSCRHFNIATSKCKAFEGDIPLIILEGGNKHKRPLKGQKNKIVYEPR